MNRNRIVFGLVILVTFLVVIYGIRGMLEQPAEDEYSMVSVILDDSNSNRWISLKKGMDQAAAEYHIRLNVVSTGRFQDVSEFHSVLERELRQGAEGVLLQSEMAINEEELFSGASSNMKCVLLDHDYSAGEFYTTVSMDHEAAGKDLAKEILEDYGDRTIPVRVGIAAGDLSMLSQKQMYAAIEHELAEGNVNIMWSAAWADSLKEEILASPVDVLICMNNMETEKAAECVDELNIPVSVYGIGCSESLVHALKLGRIRKLIVPNEYLMGYLGVQALYKQISEKSHSVQNVQFDYVEADQMNMYDPDREHILFPLVQ